MLNRNLSLMVIAAVLGLQAHASSCSDVIDVIDTENWRIDHRGQRIGQLQAMVNADDAQLNTTLIPLQASAARVLKVYDARAGANNESLEAVTAAIGFIEETLIKRPVRELQLDRLRQEILQAPAVPLADQLSDFAARANIRKDDAVQIMQLANAVRLLEKSTKDWQAAETEVLNNYLSGNQSLVLGLYQKLTKLKERLQADIDALTAARVADQSRSDAAVAEVVRVQAKRASEVNEIAANQAANVQSAINRSKAVNEKDEACMIYRGPPYNPAAF